MSRLTLLALAVLALSACGGDDEQAATGATEPGELALRVGLVTDVGQLNDRGFNQLAFEGLQRAERELAVEGRVLESGSDAEYVPNHSSLAEEGYDVVIGVGFAQGEAVAQVAQQFPDTKVVIIDGYQAGAKAAVPGVTMLNGYSQDWDDLAKCKEVALDQLARGSQVVFQVAGGCGLGALDAAKEKDVWGIGVDADQAFLGDHVLTSALKRVDQAVFQTIEAVVDGSFAGGGVSVFGPAEEGVGLGETSPNAPADAVAETEAQIDPIVAGEVEIPETVE